MIKMKIYISITWDNYLWHLGTGHVFTIYIGSRQSRIWLTRMKVSHIGSTYGRHTPIRACAPGTRVSYGSWVCLTLGSVVSPLIPILDILAQIIWFYLDLIYSLFKDEDMSTVISNRHICGVGQYAG